MAGTCDKRQQIAAALTGVRIQLQDQILLLQRKFNFGQHFLESVRNHPWEWMGVAAGFGWLLSRITQSQGENLHSRLESGATQELSQRTPRPTLESGVGNLQTSDRRVPCEKTGGESEHSRKEGITRTWLTQKENIHHKAGIFGRTYTPRSVLAPLFG